MRWLKQRPWLLLPIVVLGIGAGILIPRGGSPEPALAGTVLPERTAPQFTLTDQFGRRVSLSQYRGHPVILTFMEAHCTELCPLVAETIRRNLQELGAAGKNVVVLAVSTDPEGDTPAAVRSFSRAHGMLRRWLFLTASRRTLTHVWQSYYIFAAPANAPAKVRDSHSSGTYLIDDQGRERVFMGGDPDGATLRRDLLILSGLPVEYRGPRGVPAPEVGHPAPAFTLASLGGARVRPSSFGGQVVLLNFWATWCKPCKAEMPRLESWYRRLHGHGFTVLGIDEQESRADIAAFTRRLHVSYPIALDPNGDVAARYNVQGTPASLLVDRHGVIAEVHLGTLDNSYLATHVAPLVADSSAPSPPPAKLQGTNVFSRHARPAPSFALKDQNGRIVTLASLHHEIVALAFLDSRCTQECPIVGRSLAHVQQLLGPRTPLSIVIVSVNLKDTPASVRAFIHRAGITGDWHWLLGTRAQLQPVWNEYGVTVDVQQGQVLHNAEVYLLDGSGAIRLIDDIPFVPAHLAASVRALESH